jgi:D-alanyl-D-alanine carboxypeptidase (penicillin-binding protein 5/6)
MLTTWRRYAPALAVLGIAILLSTRVPMPEPLSVVWVPVAPRLEISYTRQDSAEPGPRISAHAAILLENTTGTVLYAKNEHALRAPASLTKIMTALLAIENGRLSDMVTVSRQAAGVWGSSAHLFAGQQIRLEDLLYGMLLPSGNDAAVAVAEHIGGSLSAFVRLMNERARELGATRTHFTNPHGLDRPGHLSTAFDLAMLSRLALLYPLFADIVGTRSHSSADWNQTWRNTNKLLWSYEGTEGIKTGTTGQAGNCLAAAASRQGMQLIGVVLGSADRWSDTAKLFNYGFDNFSVVAVAERGTPLAQIRLRQSTRPLVLVPTGDLQVLVRNSEAGSLSTELVLGELSLPIKRQARLGSYEVFSGDRRLASIPLKAEARVDRVSLWYLIRSRLWP